MALQTSRGDHSADLRLVRDIAAGQLDAWHEFVALYSGLILSIARRYLADFDQETHRDAYVLVLEYMYSGGLVKYDGRAALSTWVMTVARTRSIDYRRELRGRKRDPEWLARLSEQDRDIFRFYYENGEDITTIQARFARRGEALEAADISRSLDRIEARMNRRLRERIAYDLYARSRGMASGSLLRYLDHLRLVLAEAEEKRRPDIELLEGQTRRVLEQFERSMEALEVQERKVLDLHYYQRLPPPQIATAMGLSGPRRVYVLIDRAIAHLRRMMDRSGEPRARMDQSGDPRAEMDQSGEPRTRGASRSARDRAHP